MGNMINRKLLITTVLSVVLFAGNSVFAGSDLLRMDVKKASSDDTVDVTFYTTGTPTNTVVTRKSGNTYVVLLPNVAGNQSIVPSLGGVKDLVSGVSVKNVDDGIGGYTKVTFNTTKPVKIQTYTKKTAPLTKAQQDYKNLIAQNSKFDPDKKLENFKKTSTSTLTTATSNVKSAVSTTKTTITKPVEAKKVTPQTTQVKTTQPKTQQTTPKIALKSVSVHVPVIKSAVKQETAKSVSKTNQIQDKKSVNKVENKPVQKIQSKVETKAKTEIKIESQPKSATKVQSQPKAETKPVITTPVPSFDLKNPPAQSKSIKADNLKTKAKTVKSKTARNGLPIIPIAGALSVIGIFILGALMNIVAKAVKNNSKLKEYLENYNSEPNQTKAEDFSKIAENDNLSWQEKYKLYSQTKDIQNQGGASYVTNLDGSKGVLADNDIAARVSQMEHALSQTPSIKQFNTVPKGVLSEDDAITNKMSGLHLKSFAKSLDLKMTSRQNLPAEDAIATNPLKEGQFVKLKNTGLNMSQRNIGGHGFSISDLVRKGRRFLPKEKVSDAMNEIQEQYLVSSMEEYLSILDKEEQISNQSTTVTEEITNLIPKHSRRDMMKATNPIEKSIHHKKLQTSDFNIEIKSKYDIDNDKSIYMIESDGVSAIIGKIGENVYVLKKFDKIINKPLQVRLDYGNVYIVRAGGFKCLVDVAEDKMGTLLEI